MCEVFIVSLSLSPQRYLCVSVIIMTTISYDIEDNNVFALTLKLI